MAEKRPTAKALRALPADDLTAQLGKLRQELWQHRLKARDGSLQQTHVLLAARRQIARVQTLLRESAAQQKTT
ncbi:MAG: 50S ribosomal protein L29 [Candidatus Omnitrophica bacterium]|nr:50S ribosomal protein L29 [Candidatus Omnitrophota bacterium]